MDNFPRVVAAFLLSCVSAFASAQVATNCFQYRAFGINGQNGAWTTSQSKAASDVQELCTAGESSYPGCGLTSYGASYSHTYQCSIGSETVTPGIYDVRCTIVSTLKSDPTIVRNETITASVITRRNDPGGCPVCSPAGTRASAAAPPGGKLDGMAVGSTGCMTDNCAWTVTDERRTIIGGVGSTPFGSIRTVVSTGQTCSAAPQAQAVPTLPKAPGDTCAVASNGDVSCDAPEVGCGIYNGERVCVTAAAPGTCRTTASGGSICVTDASHPAATPPAPDNGTPGQIADTSTSITVGGSTMNYYSSSTVSGSSASGATSSGATDGVTRGTGSGTGTGSGSGTGTGAGTTGDVNDGMSGAGLSSGDKVPDHSINVGALEPQNGVLVGQCPQGLNLTVWDRSVSLDIFGPACSTLEKVRPVVLLVAWLSAAFILGGAFAVKV